MPLVTSVQILKALLPNNTAVNAVMLVPILGVFSTKCRCSTLHILNKRLVSASGKNGARDQTPGRLAKQWGAVI